MKRDGRRLDHQTLEALRLMAMERLSEGETASAVMASFGFCRTTIYKWQRKALRADLVHGRTWGKKGQTPVVAVPGQRQTVSAASAVNAKGAFWCMTYKGGLNADLFVTMLKLLMRRRRNPLYLVLDNLPSHKAKVVRDYVEATRGKLELHFLPGYAPELNPDELVWNYMKRTGVARRPLAAGEVLQDCIDAQMKAIGENPALVRAFFRNKDGAYITDPKSAIDFKVKQAHGSES